MNDETQTATRSQQPPLGMSQAYILFYLQDSNSRLETAVLGVNGNGAAGGRAMKKRKNRVDSDEEEEEEEGPTRPPAAVLGGPEIAAAAARESERMSLPHRALEEKIKAAQEGLRQQRGTIGAVLQAKPSSIQPRANLVDYAGDDEDMGEPIQATEKPRMDVDKNTGTNNLIGPTLPAGRTTEPPATGEDPPSNAVKPETATSSLASEIRTIPSASFYGTSKPAPARMDFKKRSSPSPPPPTASYKRPKHESKGADYYRSRSSNLWQNNLNRETVGGRRGEEDIPRVRATGPGMPGGGIKKNMKPKKRSLM